jgi:hypothetical protein
VEIQPLNRLILGYFDHVVAEYRTPGDVFSDRRRVFLNEYDTPAGMEYERPQSGSTGITKMNYSKRA